MSRARIRAEPLDVTYVNEDSAEAREDFVRVIPRLEYALRGATSTAQTIPLVIGIDTSRWRRAALVVRVYSQTSWPAGSSISVLVDNVLVRADSPQTVFVGSRLCAQTITATTPPVILVKEIDPPIGPQLQVLLRSTYSTTAGVQQFAIGVDLVGRFD